MFETFEKVYNHEINLKFVRKGKPIEILKISSNGFNHA